MTDLIEIHVTYQAEAPALAAARRLVEERLAACAHVAGPVRSHYRWDGALQIESEWTVTAKTRADLFDAAAAAILSDHPYEQPGLFATPMTATATFSNWIVAETRAPKA